MTSTTTLQINCIHSFRLHPQDEYTNVINAVAISPDQSKIAAVGDKPRHSRLWAFTLWDLSSGEKIDIAAKNLNQAHNANINALVFSTDNQWVLLGSSDQTYNHERKSTDYPSLSFWNLNAVPEHQIQTLENGCILTVVNHPSEQQFATLSTDGKLCLWHDCFSTGQLPVIKDWQSQSGYSLIFSHDGSWLFSGGMNGEISQWDAISGDLVKTFDKQSNQIRSLALSYDGKTLVSGSDQRIKIWDVETGAVKQSFFGHPDWVRGLAITKDNQFLISVGDHKINVWDLATAQKLQSIKAHPAAIRSLALSRDGSLLVTGSRDGTVKVWKIGA